MYKVDWIKVIVFGWGVVLAVTSALVFVSISFAETSRSDNYQATELEFGSSSEIESCSGEYCAHASIGSLDVDGSASASHTASFGPIASDSEPMLEVIVEPGESNLGVLTTEKTATKTTKVKIRSYLSGGYTLHIYGDPPQYQQHKLKTTSAPAESVPGVEQFGINVVKNTSPSLGNNPMQVPSEQTSFGYPSQGYDVPNFFRYISGDEIARSDTESGQTEFTISMVVNISNSTPSGHFTGDFSAVVVPLF